MTELVKGYSNEDLEGMIENEGLDYFFNGYLSFEKIVDTDLRDAVGAYIESRQRIIRILDEHRIEVND